MKKVVFLLFSVVFFASCTNETTAPVEEAVVDSVVVDSAAVEVECCEVDSMMEVAK
jgi:PBP1b-binding outer membrane lipoprotein LpoB